MSRYCGGVNPRRWQRSGTWDAKEVGFPFSSLGGDWSEDGDGLGVWRVLARGRRRGCLGNLMEPSEGMNSFSMSQSIAFLAANCFAAFLELNVTGDVLNSISDS